MKSEKDKTLKGRAKVKNIEEEFKGKIDKNQFDNMLKAQKQFIDNFENEYEKLYLGKLEKYQLEQSEHGRNHNSFFYEHRMIEYVKSGDLEGIKKLYRKTEVDVEFSTIGNVSSDFFKKYEYYMVTGIILFSRAAVEAGVSVERAYELSDIFLRELSVAKTLPEYFEISMLSTLMFTKLVADDNNKKYPFVDACKDYIARNLRKPFKIQDIGRMIGVNNSYLSKVFSKTENMTISQYVTKKRCMHAANLLRYSEYSISEIAEYFCFSSQSHFGVQFKKIYGITPREYRNKYKESGTYNIIQNKQ